MTDPSRLLIDAIATERGLMLVLSGAGISVASDIPTFGGTDEGAVWARDVTEMATLRFFRRDPAARDDTDEIICPASALSVHLPAPVFVPDTIFHNLPAP